MTSPWAVPRLRTASLGTEIAFLGAVAGSLACVYIAWPLWRGFEYEDAYLILAQQVSLYVIIRLVACLAVWLWELLGQMLVQGESAYRAAVAETCRDDADLSIESSERLLLRHADVLGISIVAACLHAYLHMGLGTRWLTEPVAELFGRDAAVLLARVMKGSRPEVLLGMRVIALGCVAWIACRLLWVLVLALSCRLTLERCLPTTPLVQSVFKRLSVASSKADGST